MRNYLDLDAALPLLTWEPAHQLIPNNNIDEDEDDDEDDDNKKTEQVDI